MKTFSKLTTVDQQGSFFKDKVKVVRIIENRKTGLTKENNCKELKLNSKCLSSGDSKF